MAFTTDYVIERALSRLAVLRIGQSPSANQAKTALYALNDMIRSFEADGIYLDPTIPIPAKHAPGLIALLAARLAPDYGIEAPAPLQREALNGMHALQASYIFAPDAGFDTALRNLPSQRLLGQRGVPFTITSVTPDSSPSVDGFCTLTAGSPTTAVPDASCLTTSTITLTPYSSTAQDEWNYIRPVVTAGPAAGQFTITHQKNVIPDRVFEYLIKI